MTRSSITLLTIAVYPTKARPTQSKPTMQNCVITWRVWHVSRAAFLIHYALYGLP